MAGDIRRNGRNRVALALAVLLSYGVGISPIPAAESPSAGKSVTHVKVICHVYVDETGTPTKADVAGTEPNVILRKNTREDVLAMSIFSRKFPVRFENGKPAAGYRTVPVEIEFDTPVPLAAE